MADSQRDPPSTEKKKSDSPDKQPPTDPTSKHVTFADDQEEAKGRPKGRPKKSRKPVLDAPIKSALKRSRTSSESSCGSPLTSPPPEPIPSFGDQLVGIPSIDSEEVDQPMEQSTPEELPESPTDQQAKYEEWQGRSKRRRSSVEDDSPDPALADLRTLEALELTDQASLDAMEAMDSEADPPTIAEASDIFSPEGTQSSQMSPATTTPEEHPKPPSPAKLKASLASPDTSSISSLENIPTEQPSERPASSSSAKAGSLTDVLLATGGYRVGLFRALSPIKEGKEAKSDKKRKRSSSSDDKDSASSSSRSSPILKTVTKCIKNIKERYSPPRTSTAIQTDDPATPETDEDRKNVLRPSKVLKRLQGPTTMESSAQTVDEFKLEENDKDKNGTDEDQGDPAPSKLKNDRKPGDDDEDHGSAALIT